MSWHGLLYLGMPCHALSYLDIPCHFQDPEVMEAFQAIVANPMSFSQYQSNPKVAAITKKRTSARDSTVPFVQAGWSGLERGGAGWGRDSCSDVVLLWTAPCNADNQPGPTLTDRCYVSLQSWPSSVVAEVCRLACSRAGFRAACRQAPQPQRQAQLLHLMVRMAVGLRAWAVCTLGLCGPSGSISLGPA